MAAFSEVEPWLREAVQESLASSPRSLPAYVAGLAGTVRPTAEEERRGRAATHIVVQAAHQVDSLTFDRTCVGGSTDRKVSIAGDPDVDLVLLVNMEHELTPQKRLVAFHSLLSRLRDHGHGLRRVRIRWSSDGVRPILLKLKLSPSEGVWVPMDISLGQNLVGKLPPGANPAAEQRLAVLRRIYVRSPPEYLREDDVALCEAMRDLIAEAPGEVNDAVRLAKCWTKYLFCYGLLPACTHAPLSVMIEVMLLAVWRALKGRPGRLNAADCLLAFLHVLPLVASRARQIIITKYYTLRQAQTQRAAWQEDMSPVVLHPVNPSNNLGKWMDQAGWQQLAGHAVTLRSVLMNGAKPEWEASTLGQAVKLVQSL